MSEDDPAAGLAGGSTTPTLRNIAQRGAARQPAGASVRVANLWLQALAGEIPR
jgi:hypothetical protein